MERQKRALAIHDISCVGRCSLTVALPIISAAGVDTGVLPTSILSTHTGGFEGYTFRDLTEDLIPIANHWKSLKLRFDALYSGFLGSFEQIDLVAQIFDDFRTQDTLIMVDPVMADNGVLYSIYSPEMAKGMAKLCAKADIVVPNLTEAAFILDEPYRGEKLTPAEVGEIVKKLVALGPKQAVLTGISFTEGRLGAVCYDKEQGEMSYFDGELIEGYYHGTGDVFGSALLGGLLSGMSLERATKLAVDYTNLSIVMTKQLNQERRYGVCFERALPFYIKELGLG
ncbi:MAG TPA: pyridoxamine kinase [Clostridiales bacterium]|jgi:pyridoxine kinase|nr:pyridoxamine kinase [Clostridiales bacterium]